MLGFEEGEEGEEGEENGEAEESNEIGSQKNCVGDSNMQYAGRAAKETSSYRSVG